jgi:hypothetical protein
MGSHKLEEVIRSTNVRSRGRVTVDGVWIGNWICCILTDP